MVPSAVFGGGTARATPTLSSAAGSVGWGAVSAGSDCFLGIERDGLLCTWGANSYGQLGDSAMADKNVTALADGLAADSEGSITRVAGANRYETAIKTSEKNFASADNVILATGMNYADALSASALAGSLKAPLLLARPDALDSGVLGEIQRLKAKKAYIMGSSAAVSNAVEGSLTSAGLSVERIAGADRYATSAAIASKVASLEGAAFTKKAFLARGDNFADGLSASPVAYKNKVPVILTRSAVLAEDAKHAIKDLEITDVTMLGSTAAIAKDVEDDVKDLATTTRRLQGADRYATAQAIAEHALDNSLATTGFIGVATGLDFPDALAGGMATGKHGGIMVLTRPEALSPVWGPYLKAAYVDAGIKPDVQVYGGSNVVSGVVFDALKALLIGGAPGSDPDDPDPDPGDGSPTGVSIGVSVGSPYMPLRYEGRYQDELLGIPAAPGTCTLVATVLPASASKDTDITWSSSQTSVATVDSNGKVTAADVGQATITATTQNGKKADIVVTVAPFAMKVGYSIAARQRTPAGFTVGSHAYMDMRKGEVVPLPFPDVIEPEGAFSGFHRRFYAKGGGVAQDAIELIDNGDGTESIKAINEGWGMICWSRWRGPEEPASAVFADMVFIVRPALTDAQIPSAKAMSVGEEWRPTITLTPQAYPEDAPDFWKSPLPTYTVESSDSNTVRVEENGKKVYAVKSGTAQVRVKIDGVVKSTCNVTVSQPVLGQAALRYNKATHTANGKATLTLGVTPTTGATHYLITEHVAYTKGMTAAQLFASSNIKTRDNTCTLKAGSAEINRYGNQAARQWVITSAQAGSTLTFTGIDTGLRFFSIQAYTAYPNPATPPSNASVLQAPVLYHPRNVGGTNESTSDGRIESTWKPCYNLVPGMSYPYMGDDGWMDYGYITGSMSVYYAPGAPWGMLLTYDDIPGASGYDVPCIHNGKEFGQAQTETSGEIQKKGSRCIINTGLVFQNGSARFDIKPYVRDADNNKVYGETRTVLFPDVRAEYFYSIIYWDTDAVTQDNSPILEFPFTYK